MSYTGSCELLVCLYGTFEKDECFFNHLSHFNNHFLLRFLHILADI
jgi:hypothetical protein